MGFRRIFQLSLLSALVLLPLPSAQAHAERVASNPVAGAHLDVLPAQVEVTFDGNLLNIGSAKTNVLIVKDPQGRQIDAKNSQVSGAKLSVGVSPVTASGDFTVSWRVVSGDGHPEEGYANAVQAAAFFQKSGNVAGLLASQFEQTYALQFESKAESWLTPRIVAMEHPSER